MTRITIALASVCAISLLIGTASSETTLDSTISAGNWLTRGLEEISTERMMADIRELSGPAFSGRQTGTDDDQKSAAFVADRFSALRLHRSTAAPPANQTNPLPQREWKQTLSVIAKTIQPDPLIQIEDHSPLRSGSDFLPILDSPSADINATIVFVGYGISDPAQGIDDYAGLDVRNKIVLFLRGKPEPYKGAVAQADKVRIAKEKGAVAYLTATGPVLSPYELRRGVTGTPTAIYDTSPPLPGAWISTAIAESIVAQAPAGKGRLRDIQEAITRTNTSRSFATEVTARLTWTTTSSTGTLFNIASIIRGYSPRTQDTVIIGAHRDHFGLQGGRLFAGADDNASGTAVMLEVARILASAPAAPKRSILLLSFSGEEQGLLGSRHYVSQPIVPLASTVGMINIDHAGVGNGRLTVGVTGMEKTVASTAGETAGLSDKLDLYGFFPGGDHVPFKEAGVPTVTVVSGGVHPHFHQPTDTADTIDPEILKSVARYVLALAWQLANTP
ncbi:MAG: M20/M25/M40 family metallo-hydrolase [Nitrospira sp.]|nr:M20/M25/M40 family metallo-hydrolase [Nitrospira sp.]